MKGELGRCTPTARWVDDASGNVANPVDDAPPPLIQPRFGERALHLPHARAIVAGDLHVGLETDLAQSGVNLPSQTHRMRERLLTLVQETGAKRLIIIGDLKHRIPYSTRQEQAELPAFFRGFPASVELVRGNHDVDLDGLLNMEIHEAGGIRVGDVGLLHGHEWPHPDVMQARVIVTSHNHPAVMLVDPLGHRHKEACWVRARFTPKAKERYPDIHKDAELIVIPAFNELTGGTAFNAPEGGRLLGPLFGNGLVNVDQARLYTTDGVELGTIESLRRFGEENKRARSARAHMKRKPGWIE